MPIVVGISLRTAGKIYNYDPGEQRYYIGERVLVETARGLELGTVKLTPHEVDVLEEGEAPLKPINRRATVADIVREAANREREERALQICKRLVDKLVLPMNLIDAQYTLDCSHILIHFLADNRVDFRELVRELAHELHARIELRQVGVRDEARLIGGYGICGCKLCCSAFLGDFMPVAISMAKDQGLALNPQKISGSCGRLMCCLAFECDQYRVGRADLPRLNATVQTPAGAGKVSKLNVLSRMIEVILDDSPLPVWYSADELATHTCCRNKPCMSTPAAGGLSSDTLEVGEDYVALFDDVGDDLTTNVSSLITEEGIAQKSSLAARNRRNQEPSRQQSLTPPVQLIEQPSSLLGGLAEAVATSAQTSTKRKRRRKSPAAKDAAAPVQPAIAAEGIAPSSTAAMPHYRQRRRRRPPVNSDQ